MSIDDPFVPVWVKSTYCADNTCVEVAISTDAVAVRDGKHPDGPVLRFGRSGWDAFVAGLRAGGLTG